MTRIYINADEPNSEVKVEVEPGCALLVGRAPDPSRLDWDALIPQQSRCALMRARTTPAPYRLETLTVPWERVSANHLLVLADGAAIAVCDLGSRNGSFIKLGPHRVMVTPAGQGLRICLARAAAPLVTPTRPQDAQWSSDADFCIGVEQALTTWLQQLGDPVRVIRSAPGCSAEGFLLADQSIITLKSYGTLQFPAGALMETVRAYIHDQNARFVQLKRRPSELLSASPEVRQILARTAAAASGSLRTLFLGPGSGSKELLARCYHHYSPRHAGPFRTLNCALVTNDRLHAQLFGACGWSFTGAAADSTGLVEAAHSGTLFLDELGEMNPEMQRSLLRFLDSRGEYYRLGDSQQRHSDVQLVCGSSAPLDDPAYRCGRFRDDLWYRLATCIIHVSPLDTRPEDVRACLELRTRPAAEPLGSAALLAQSRIGATPLHAPSKLRAEAALPANTELGWERIAREAIGAFLVDQGEKQAGWDQLQLFVESYLKPMFVAQAAALVQAPGTARAVSYSALARRLRIGDGSTVKTHLLRFEKRFIASVRPKTP